LRLEEDINPIVESYEQFNQGQLQAGIIKEKYSYLATFNEIAENDFNLNIPRYVDTFEEEAEVDIAAVQQEIEGLEGALKTVQSEIEEYLTQLVD
jgi:type I restriction enzyme M protein